MEVTYQRDLDHNYMILENETVTGEEYTVRMMEHNAIPELLKCQLRRLNGKTYLYYEITSRQPVSQIYEISTMKSRDIKMLLSGIQNGLTKARQYLLNFENFLLDPEYIYMDPENGKVQLCYCPGLVLELSLIHIYLEEWLQFIRELGACGEYDVLILDLGNQIEECYQILNQCKEVYMPVLEDPISRAKILQFEKSLRALELSELQEKIRKLHLPEWKGHGAGQELIERLVKGRLGDYIRRLLAEEDNRVDSLL